MLNQKEILPAAMHLLIAQHIKAALACVALLVALGATKASAAPVVVGSVNPLTNRVTIFEDLMANTFADGGPILHFRGGYGTRSKAYFLVRAGKTATGGCRTEFFRLVRLEDNRLAIADPTNNLAAWNPQIISKLFATFDCTSSDCLFCESADPNDPLGTDPESGCACNQGTGSFAGTCDSARPETVSYGPRQIVTL